MQADSHRGREEGEQRQVRLRVQIVLGGREPAVEAELVDGTEDRDDDRSERDPAQLQAERVDDHRDLEDADDEVHQVLGDARLPCPQVVGLVGARKEHHRDEGEEEQEPEHRGKIARSGEGGPACYGWSMSMAGRSGRIVLVGLSIAALAACGGQVAGGTGSGSATSTAGTTGTTVVTGGTSGTFTLGTTGVTGVTVSTGGTETGTGTLEGGSACTSLADCCATLPPAQSSQCAPIVAMDQDAACATFLSEIQAAGDCVTIGTGTGTGISSSTGTVIGTDTGTGTIVVSSTSISSVTGSAGCTSFAPTPDPCSICLATSCCPQQSACLAVSACTTMDECFVACFGGQPGHGLPCAQMCLSQNPTPEGSSLEMCGEQACASQCN